MARNQIFADIVVIGGGVSGLVASAAASQQGAKIVVLEKKERVGGILAIPGAAAGFFAVESRLQRQKFLSLTRDEAFKIIMNYSHWKANPYLVRALVEKSSETVDWVESLGLQFTELSPTAMFDGSRHTQHYIRGGGEALLQALLKEIGKTEGRILLGVRGRRLIKENERIVGVIAEDSMSNEIRLDCKAVIIATGGYANDAEMIRRYTGFSLGEDLLVAREDAELTGDGIKMAYEVGAGSEGLGVLILNFTIPGPGVRGTELDVVKRQPYLLVNKHGRRFCDETILTNWPFGGNAIAKQKDKTAYLIFDEQTKMYMKEQGIDYGTATGFLPATKLAGLDLCLENALKQGNQNIFIAGSLEELARMIGIGIEPLKQTVSQYNLFCSKGHDDQFAKDARYLRPVIQPPFYAFRMIPFFLATVGGIKVNENTEVLTEEGRVIPGLFAIGNDSAALYGDSYDLYIPATALGYAVNSGRIAAENAVSYIREV